MYILLADWSRDDAATGDDTAAMMAAHRRYDAYLEANRHRFPEQAFAFAAAPWHHDFSDHRAPHDAWVQSFRFVDASLPDGGDKRLVDLEIVLLGAYHDGHLHLTYRRVHRYALAGMDVRDGPTEIYRDEVRLSKSKRVLHEIEFLGRRNWLIECEDIEARWEPFEGSTPDLPAGRN